MDRRARYPGLQVGHVLTSGGAHGIGPTLLRHFAAQGAQVSLIDVAADDAARLLAQLRSDGFGCVEFLRCDVPASQRCRPARAPLRGWLLFVHEAGSHRHSRSRSVELDQVLGDQLTPAVLPPVKARETTLEEGCPSSLSGDTP
jgi:NAD(P)-dependent dehydrogenase (short-subunit alcohol dehydrogenase family)